MTGPELMEITPIPAFQDNYFWLLSRGDRAAVVDPGDAAPVRKVLAERGLTLDAILITHHHYDHIGGLPQLTREFSGPVYGPAAERIRGVTRDLSEGDRVRLPSLGVELEVWEVPGHTLGHIAYVARDFVLCGDTLFSAGCGRLFEGTAEQLHRSLSRLAALPAETRVFCTHEYTLSNLAFAQAVEPDRAELAAEIRRVRELRAAGAPSLPSTIGHERRINPFLRVTEPTIVSAATQHENSALETPLAVFAALRRWKDSFKSPAGV